MESQVATVQLSGLTPKGFWKHYISQRQPVVVRQGAGGEWDQLTDDLLVSKAGDAMVMVEHRSSSSDSFGQGRKSPMLLREFIRHMQQGDTKLYMSTQEVGVGRDGHPLLYGPPLMQLEGCFPLRQPLCGNLVPQSINMWMGCAPEGSSSGLHHDFHDNLYVLLRGSKRFRLFPPTSAPNMYLAGNIVTIHPNGRIVYEGQGDIRPDGTNAHDVKLWMAHHAADAAAAAAAAAAGGSAEAAAAEALLEAQLETMLKEGGGLGGSDDFDEFGGGGVMDDYVDSDDDAAGCSSSDSGEAAAKTGRAGRGGGSAGPKQRQQLGAAAAAPAAAGAAEPPPPSFSAVQLSLPAAELRRRFPRFPGLSAAAEVLLQPGDMLYLPAGWFHEVASFGGAGLDGGHLAFNYWYHPPDHLDPGKGGFAAPYTSPYLPTMWANREAWIQQETRAWWQQQQQQQRSQPLLKGQPMQPQQPSQQQQQRKQTRPRKAQRRRVVWAQGVSEPANAYKVSNTRAGTATGRFDKLPLQSGLIRPSSISSSDDASDDGTPDGPPHSGPTSQGAAAATARRRREASPPPDDEAQHRQLGREVSEGLEALEAYFEDNPEAMQQMLAEFLASRRARLAAGGSRAAQLGLQMARLPRLRGRRHHYAVLVRWAPRRPKPKPSA